MPEQEYDTSIDVVEAPEAPAELAPQTPAEAPAEGQVETAEPEVGLASPTFTVKVDGVEQQVSLEEALSGYQRHADYTRKTQEVASERQALESQRETLSQAQRLWDAIENNPQSSIAALASAYGFKLTPAQEAAAEAARGASDDDPFSDLYEDGEQAPKAPVEDERWAKVEAFIAQQEADKETAIVAAELAAVHTKYGVAFNDADLIEYAIENSIGSLDAAFRAMSFEAAQQAASRRQRTAAKQELPPVAPGHSVQGGVLVPGAGSALPSIEESFEAALAEMES